MVVDRHTLEDLYSQGVDFELHNPKNVDEPIKLFMRKLGTVQQQKAVKKANAARLVESKVKDRDDDDLDKMVLVDGLSELGEREEWIEYLGEVEAATIRPKLEQEMSDEDEWSDDNYLQSLIDAWDEDMMADFDKGEDKCEPETLQIWTEMKRFNDALDKKIRRRQNVKEKELDKLEDEDLREIVLDSFSERNASLAWLRTFRDNQILHGLENPEGDKMYDDMEQVQNVHIDMYRAFLDAIEQINIGGLELK